jgi:glucose/arabinose dehydrogenase
MPIEPLPFSLPRSLRSVLRSVPFCLAAGVLAACGGGGGGGGSSGGGTTPPVTTPTPQPPVTIGLTLAPYASGLSAPTFLTAPPADTRQFVTERAGRILILRGGTPLARPFLDIRTSVSTAGEGGLLSLAFDPGYATNGRFYVYRTDLNGDILVERYTVSANADQADPASALTIIRIPHPTYQNHVGGTVAFGPDGYLYLGTGDGGGAGDPNRNAQNQGSLLGKLLRLDVSAASVTQAYRIPSTNPYLNQAGSRGEIWASGLRNPWRFTFDTGALAGGQIYIADVGQDAREEIDVEAATQAGLNYGWPHMEGTACYQSQTCDQNGLTLPVLDYAHTTAANSPCSITGGFVYRGISMPELAGHYFYSDYCAGFIRSFRVSGRTALEQRDWNLTNVGRIVSFGQDGQGELYVLTDSGAIWAIVKARQ